MTHVIKTHIKFSGDETQFFGAVGEQKPGVSPFAWQSIKLSFSISPKTLSPGLGLAPVSSEAELSGALYHQQPAQLLPHSVVLRQLEDHAELKSLLLAGQWPGFSLQLCHAPAL